MGASIKDTGIQWIGEIPLHWSVTKVKKHCRVRPSNVDKKEHEDEIVVNLCNYVDVYYNDLITKELDFMKATASEGEIKKFQLNIGDVIITKDSEDPDDIAVSAIIKETFDHFLCGYHLSIIRSISENFDPRYLNWCLNDYSIASQLHREATGVTRWAIASRHVKNSTIPLPPLPEQRAIADYLDRATEKIDRVIAIKERQLELIDQQLSSRLSEVISKGIKNEELKESGIHWMPFMPKNWKRQRLKDVVSLKSGNSITSDDIFDVGEFPVYGGNGLRGYTDEFTHEGGFALIGRQGALCGNINYAEGKFWASEHAVVATPIHKCDIVWIGELMRAMNLNQYSNAAAQPGLAVERIKQLYIPYPDYSEQNEISDFIMLQINRAEKLKENLTKQITTLQSYRQSLIHECVTGKKRVFEAKPEVF